MDLPHAAKRTFRDQISPNVQNTMLPGSPSHQGVKIADFLKIIFHFLTIFLGFGDFFCRFRAVNWPYFEAGMLFGGFGSTRVTKSNSGLRENPYFEKLVDLRQIWPYSRYRGPDSVMQSGASPGSSVGDTMQRLDLVSMVHFDCFLSLVQVCYLTPGPKHSKPPFF